MDKKMIDRIKGTYEDDGLKAVGESLLEVISRIQDRSISYRQGNAEISGFGKIIQTFLLDGKGRFLK